VQIPFIQTILPNVPVVPVVFGRQTPANIEAVANALGRVAREKRILVVATTDLSHYKPYGVAVALDRQTVERMVKGDPRRMAEYLSARYDSMCGPGPVLAVMSYAEAQGAVPLLLKYANSGDTAGSKDAVVGYAALAFVKKNAAQSQAQAAEQVSPGEQENPLSESEFLTAHDKEVLLRLARRSLETFVRDGHLLSVDPPQSERLRENGAAFVTLRKHGQLRGCIGRMDAIAPLYQTVIEMTVAAASQDHRFLPVEPDELKDIGIEISVNTPLVRVSSPDEIILGKHGVVVARGLHQGVFLPQVATETGWSKEEFLTNLCVHKAGLPSDAYKKDADLYVFSSVIFHEER
jgi:AmmeMemoRadiSam system protein A